MKYILKNVMFGVGVVALVLIFSMVSFLYSWQEHQGIVEEVSVNWWQVPVFAIDKSGNPVTDLEPGDIQVQLNGQQIPEFTLFKRSFTVTKPGKDRESAKQQPIKKNRVLFLLFDQVLSSETSTREAKKIAEKIVMDAEEDTRFFVMTIDAFTGLVYIGEGSGDNKDQLINMIKKKVKEKKNRRSVSVKDFIAGSQNAGKFEPGDSFFFYEMASKWNKRKSMDFFYSFETLYLFLNSIEDNKFIYFFSEGMSNNVILSSRNVGGERGRFFYYFKRAAKFLSRGGAVIFIINPREMLQYSTLTSTLSGKDSLNWLAQESGGTYMEGTHEKIVARLENMHRAYYEISFPDIPQLKGTTRKVSVTSKRKGIKIYSLHTLEKRKQYTQMKPVEQELLVLNLVTQPQNTLTKRRIHAYNARVAKTKKSKKAVTYTIELPPGYLDQAIDLYKVWLAVDEQEIARVEKIEKESLSPQKNNLKIKFLFTQDKKQKGETKETSPGETRTYFVLVNKKPEPARALVHGIELYQEDPELLEFEKKETAAQRKKIQQVISPGEMKNILQGAADYCQRLKQSAFHFYCQEQIVEARATLIKTGTYETDISSAAHIADVPYRQRGLYGRRRGKTHVKSYLFGYRLIKQGNQIKEERDWISSKDNKKVKRDQVVKASTFFSEKAVFAPITILDRTRQDRYNFQFIRFDKRNGRQVAVIEALPENPVETATIYGTLWIDMEDFSILKIEADPRSIKGYSQLKKVAEKLRTRLHLSLEIDFDRQQKGIRFPTKVSFLEKYKGGRIISMYHGPKGWERIRTRFIYSDYQFFSVQTDVTVH